MKYWVGFSFNDNFFSRLMKKAMSSPYSHVFLLFEIADRKLVFHCTRHAVNVMGWDEFQKHNQIIKMVERSAKYSDVLDYSISKLGTPYSYLAVIAIELGLHYEDGEKTLICSEFVARALGLDFNKLSDLITPRDIDEKLST